MTLPIDWQGLSPSSLPAPNEVWRVTVRRANDAARLGLEILTLSLWDTSVRSVATDWTLRIHKAGLGTLYAEPVIDEAKGLFVVDMQFDSATPLVPASSIVGQWEDMIPNTAVIAVRRVVGGERYGPGAVAGQADALGTGGARVESDSIGATLGRVVDPAVKVAKGIGTGILVLGVIALLVAGAVLEKRLRS